MPILCRACRTELTVSATGCPICLRPRTPQEIAADAKQARADDAYARRKPLLMLVAAAGLGGAGYLLTTRRAALSEAAGEARRAAARAMEKAASDASDAALKTPAQSPPPPAPSPLPGDPAAGPARPDGPSAPSPAPGEPDWTLPPANAAAMQNSWLARGFVYDLSTARPLPGAVLVFSAYQDADGGSWPVNADSRGYYQIWLSKRHNYEVTVAAPGFLTGPLPEESPRWRERPPEARGKAAADARAEGRERFLLVPEETGSELLLDFALVPKK